MKENTTRYQRNKNHDYRIIGKIIAANEFFLN